ELHDHRDRAPDARRHGDPRLHPRVGPRAGARPCRRAVRPGARGGRRGARGDRMREARGEPSVLINVGHGDGVTVRELVAAFERVFGHDVPITEAPPRPGCAVGAFANDDGAAELLDWRTQLSIDDAIASALAWG